MNLETEELLEVNEEVLKVLRRRVLGAREEHAAVVLLTVDKLGQLSIAQPTLRRHRALEVRADNAADPVDCRVGAAVALWLYVARLLDPEARHTRHALVPVQLDTRCQITRHEPDRVEREVAETLVPVQQRGFVRIVHVFVRCVRFKGGHDRITCDVPAARR